MSIQVQINMKRMTLTRRQLPSTSSFGKQKLKYFQRNLIQLSSRFTSMTAGMTRRQCTAHLSELSAPLCNSYLRCSHISRTWVFSSPSNLLFVGLSFPPMRRQKQQKIKWCIFKVPVFFSNRKQRISFYCFVVCFF